MTFIDLRTGKSYKGTFEKDSGPCGCVLVLCGAMGESIRVERHEVEMRRFRIARATLAEISRLDAEGYYFRRAVKRVRRER